MAEGEGEEIMNQFESIAALAEHKGACEALLAAARLLRRCGHAPAADLLIENVSNLVPEVPTLPEMMPCL